MDIRKRLLFSVIFISLLIIVSASVLTPENIKEELSKIRLDLVEKQASLELVRQKLSETDKDIITTRVIKPGRVDSKMQTKLNDLKAQMAEKLTIYREKHPVIKRLQTRIDYFERMIESQKEQSDTEQKVEVNPQFTELKSQQNLLETKIKGLEARRIELEKMLNTIESQSMKDEKSQPGKGQKKEVNIFTDKRVVKTMKLIVVIAFFVVVIALIFLMLKKNAAQVNKLITKFKDNLNEKVKKMRMKKEKKVKELSEDIIAVIPRVKNTEPYDISIIDRDGQFNDVFNRIAENLRNATRSVLITPYKTGAGGSFLTVNLANIIAGHGERVLVIDSDFADPVLHRVFSVENEHGFSDVLEGMDPHKLIKSTDNRNIDILTSGLDPIGAGELFENTLFPDFIARMENEYSRVILDMPSIEKSELSNIAGKFVPYIVVINKEEQASICKSNAESRNNVLLGCVMNKK